MSPKQQRIRLVGAATGNAGLAVSCGIFRESHADRGASWPAEPDFSVNRLSR